MQEGTEARLHCHESVGSLVALDVDTLITDDGHFVTCNLHWPGQLVRLALTVLKRNDRDFMVVISLDL
jgi:hypothetical protein